MIPPESTKSFATSIYVRRLERVGRQFLPSATCIICTSARIVAALWEHVSEVGSPKHQRRDSPGISSTSTSLQSGRESPGLQHSRFSHGISFFISLSIYQLYFDLNIAVMCYIYSWTNCASSIRRVSTSRSLLTGITFGKSAMQGKAKSHRRPLFFPPDLSDRRPCSFRTTLPFRKSHPRPRSHSCHVPQRCAAFPITAILPVCLQKLLEPFWPSFVPRRSSC